MFNKKVMAMLLVCIFVCAPFVHAAKLFVDDTATTNWHDLKVTRASSSGVSAGLATIDLSTLAQSSTSAAETVLTLSQSDIDQSMMAFTCTEGIDNACISCYTTTDSAKAGTIQIQVNGVVKYLQFFDEPD